MLKKLFLIILTFSPLFIVAQFTVSGTASQNGCNCFDLTQAGAANSTGGFFQNATIDLANNFDLKFTVNFGCDNNGGEGVAFILQSSPWTIGNGGSELGYGGLANSLAIEFDTKDSDLANGTSLGEIPPDHIAIQKNGDVAHNGPNNMVPVPFTPPNISTSYVNVEDCNDHIVEIIWVAAPLYTIDILVDGNSSYGGPQPLGNIVTDIFGGNSNVQWGWTGSSSIISNTQTVCLALEPDINFSAASCTNQPINFTTTSFSFNPIVSYAWDFDGLGTSNLSNPSFTFATGGTHPVDLTITDAVGCTSTKTFNVGVGFDANVTADPTTICPNGTSQLEVTALPYVGNDCCFDLVLTNVWSSWYGDSIYVYADGVIVGGYTMFQSSGGVTSEVYELCFDQDANIDIIIVGNTPWPGECSYQLLDASGNVVVEVVAGNATWFAGNTQSFTVDCGIIPPIYTYQWDNVGLLDNATIANPTASIPTANTTTTFTVQVTDPNGCTIPSSVQVTTSPAVTATLSGNVTVCEGDSGDLSVVFTGTPPFDLDYIDPNGTTVTVTGINTLNYTLSSNICGNYSLSAVTGNGCGGTRSGTGVINCITLPVVDIESNDTYCDGDAINAITVVSVNGGTVNWYNNPGLTGAPISTGNSFLPPATVGTNTYYAQEIEPILGCAGPADNVTITINPIPPAPNVTGVTTYCENDLPTPLVAEMTYGGTASWYNNVALTPPTVSTLLQHNPTLNVGTNCYYVTETANGCTGPYTEICVLTKPTPDSPIITGTIVYCEGEIPTPLTATPNLAGQITWFNTSNTIISNTSNFTPDITLGDQTFTASETLNGCTSDLSTVSITVNILPTVDIPNSTQICFGDSIEITAVNNGFDLTWSNGDTGQTSWIGPDASTYVYVTATNPLCGFAVDSINVTVFELPNVVAGNDTVIGIGGEATLWATGTNSFLWTPSPDQCITTNCSEVYVIPNQATVYVVDGVDGNTCHNYDTVLVDISGYMDVFVPNVFSPNADGFNDYLVIDGPRLFNFTIEVYDRWGKLVFKSNEQKDTWDGKLDNTELAPQTFIYHISGETVLGEHIVKSGNVSIIY